MKRNKRTRTHSGKLNFHPSIWGEKGWDFIHCIAISYPNVPTFTDKNNYKNFFYSIGPVLPCEMCTENYEKHIAEVPIDNYLQSPEQLFYWTVLMRNLVKRITLERQGKDIQDNSLYYDPIKLKKFYCDKQKSLLGGTEIRGKTFSIQDKVLWLLVLGGIVACFTVMR